MLMKLEKMPYVKKYGPHSVNGSGLEKSNNMVRISLVFGSALEKGLRALVQHGTSAKIIQGCQA